MNYCGRLLNLKKRSVRRGIWYRVLTSLERAQIDLTVKIVKTVRSPLLARVLNSIVGKLTLALESKVVLMMRRVGFPSVLKLGKLAQGWGYESARAWPEDLTFARFLAVMSLNSEFSATGRQTP